MNRGRISISVFLCFLMMMFLVVIGCGSSDDAVLPGATYSISGTVTYAVGGEPMSGVTMNLTGDVTATTTTATDGTYSFSGIPAGTNGATVPVKTGYTFDPLSKGGHLTANQTGQDFVATVNTGLPYTISGNVSTAGSVLAGVQITLTGDATGQTVTGAGGTYSFPGIALNGNYTVTPSLAGYTFSAISIGVIVSGADSTGNNFTATANVATTYRISGTVGGATDAGVTITLSGGTFGTAITETDGNGDYSFGGLLPGSYTVTPSKAAYTFSPTSRTPIIVSADSPDQDFTSTVDGTVTLHSMGGTVSGAIADGVTINLTGAATDSTSTAAGGSYSFGGFADGAYTVTPVLAGYTFAPSSTAVTIGPNSLSNNFTATANVALKYNISGTVSGEVLSGVTITLTGAGAGTTTTNATGNYSFSGLVNGSYTVTPTLTGYTITPASRSVSVSGAKVTVANFVVGTAPTAFSQADLVGTWRMNMLARGFQSNGTTPKNEWARAKVTINSAGVAACVSASQMAYDDTTPTIGCPPSFDLKFTMNATTGVITQTGTEAIYDGGHMTMTSSKNFAAGTGTDGSGPGHSYKLMIVQRDDGTYSTTDMNSQSFVYHQLWVGTTTGSNMWSWGTGSTDGSGVATMSYECSSHACPETPGGGGTLSLATTGVVTMSGDSTWEGFLSADKKTIVGTSRDSSDGGQVSLMIIQVTGTEFTAGLLPAGVSTAHMLGAGTGFAGWIHNTTTVGPDGGITFTDWATSFGGSAPVGPFTGNITNTGTVTIAGMPTYHGQISHDGKFTVGTQTSNGSYYFLNVTTK